MKKVGILTMHRVTNYGSVLQAYATQYIIEKLGYTPIVIDYVFPNKRHHNYFSRKYLRTFIRNTYQKIFRKPEYIKSKKIREFRNKNLYLSPLYSTKNSIIDSPPQYDFYLIGSDQVWNPKHMKGDDTFLLGFLPNNAQKISFSSSFATRSIPTDLKEIYINNLRQFKNISVREDNGKSLIKELIDKDVPVTLDPTLMLDASEWKKLSISQHNNYIGKNYILLYMLNYAFNPIPYIYELLHKLQKETGLKIYSFTQTPKNHINLDIEYIIDSSPIEFIQAFENASYVVTSSFHGTAFAVNFGIPLYSIVPNEKIKDDRQTTLLKSLNLNQCIVHINDTIKPAAQVHYNIEQKETLLNEIRESSIIYLEDALNNKRTNRLLN